MYKLVRNSAKCRHCGTQIESKTIYDWVACDCFTNSRKNTGIFVDGGLDYARRGGNMENFIDNSKWVQDTDEK